MWWAGVALNVRGKPGEHGAGFVYREAWRKRVLEEFECSSFHLGRSADECADIANKVGMQGARGEVGQDLADLRRAFFFDELEHRPRLRRKGAQNGCIRVGGFLQGHKKGKMVGKTYDGDSSTA